MVTSCNCERIKCSTDEDEPHKLIIEIEFSLTIRPEVHESLTLDFLIGEYRRN